MNIPFGIDHPIEKKIEWAEQLYERFGPELVRDAAIAHLIDEYLSSVQETWKAMEVSGVTAQCTSCAIDDGGSCCGKGIENKFDVTLLLVNRLLGSHLPKKRWDRNGCWFLGEKGCTIKARHVICINYLCRRIYDNIAQKELQELQGRILREADAAFFLEETIKAWLGKRQV